MRHLIFGFILLLAAIYAGIELSTSANYVLITYKHWIIESSLWVAIVITLLSFTVLYTLIRIVIKTTKIPRTYKSWRQTVRNKKSQVLSYYSLCKFYEGEWQASEKLSLKAAKFNRKPLFNYLLAAKSAQAQLALERRDNYLLKAHLADKNAHVATSLIQSQLHIDSQQWEQALATLIQVNKFAPNNGLCLKLLTIVYVELNEWDQCKNLLVNIKKQHVFSQKNYLDLEKKVYFNLLQKVLPNNTEAQQIFWQSIPKCYQKDAEFIIPYTQQLINKNEFAIATNIIETFFKKNWSSELTLIYAQIPDDNAINQLKKAEQWHKKYPQDTTLLLCLGKLSIRAKLWGKAREYLEQHLEKEKSAAAYIQLGYLYEILNENIKAKNCFQQVAMLLKCSTS